MFIVTIGLVEVLYVDLVVALEDIFLDEGQGGDLRGVLHVDAEVLEALARDPELVLVALELVQVALEPVEPDHDLDLLHVPVEELEELYVVLDLHARDDALLGVLRLLVHLLERLPVGGLVLVLVLLEEVHVVLELLAAVGLVVPDGQEVLVESGLVETDVDSRRLLAGKFVICVNISLSMEARYAVAQAHLSFPA